MNNFYGCIYGLKSPSNKWYIGQTTCVDPMKYINTSYRYGKGGNRSKIHNSILKYGFESFEIKVFVYLFNQDELNIAEVGFIEMFNSIDAGYNCREGGSNGRLSQEVKDKIGLANTGRSHNDQTKLKMSNSRKKFIKSVGFESISKSAERYEYIVEDEFKNKFIVTNLYKFSKDHGFRCNHLSERGYSKGWSLISKTPLDLINNSNPVSMSLT